MVFTAVFGILNAVVYLMLLASGQRSFYTFVTVCMVPSATLCLALSVRAPPCTSGCATSSITGSSVQLTRVWTAVGCVAG